MLEILKMYTLSAKSSYFTLTNDNNVICRLPSKKVGTIIINALNSNLNAILTFDNKVAAVDSTPLPRLTKKAFTQLTTYIKGNNNDYSNTKNSSPAPIASVSLLRSGNTEFSGRPQIQPVRQGTQDSHAHVENQSGSAIQLLPQTVQGDDSFIERLEQLDRDISEREKSSDRTVSASAKADRRRAVFEVAKLDSKGHIDSEGAVHPEVKRADAVIARRIALSKRRDALCDWINATTVCADSDMPDEEKNEQLDLIAFEADNRIVKPMRMLSKAKKRRLNERVQAILQSHSEQTSSLLGLTN